MIKRRLLSTLTIFLFIFIFVTFLIPSDLNAETQNFWVDKSHWETKKEWVDTSHMVYQGYWKDKDVWVDTSYTVSQGYWETKKEWVDTSHMVYQGYWKDLTHNVWVDTSQWVSSGYWKDVTERVWVISGYIAYRDVKKWVDTSHMAWVSSGYTAYRDVKVWVDTSHWEKQAYNVWVSSGYMASRWVDTSHNVWVISGYSKKIGNRYVWINTSHWVWVTSGYWTYYWVNTSHYETRYRDVWVISGYNKTVKEAYWVDTSHMAWVNSGYWTTVKEAYLVDTSHYEDQKVWVKGHYETRYRNVEDWQPCDVTFVVSTEYDKWWKLEWLWGTSERSQNFFKGTINGTMYKYEKFYIYYGKFGFWDDLDKQFPDYDFDLNHPFKIRYECYEVLNWKKEAYSVWVEGNWKREWVDTSHWVKSGYWQSDTYVAWVDTSYLKSEGHWETKKEWVDTSYTVSQGYWETKKEWVDTSHWETSGYWKDKKVWVEDGFYTSPLHGEVIIEKSPRYIFTRWHKDQNNEECSMELNVSWKVDNSNLSEGEEEKEIVRIYIYQDICRFNNNGVEKVTIFNGNVTPSVEGSINTITKFDYSGNEESILHIYLYAQNGESAHVYFSNPINGFRSINLMSEGSNSDANTWLGGNNYGKFEF